MGVFQRPQRPMHSRLRRFTIYALALTLLVVCLRHVLLRAAGGTAQPTAKLVAAASASDFTGGHSVAGAGGGKADAHAQGGSRPSFAASGVPRIIHHMHVNLSALSPVQMQLREKCRELHPNWELKFWTDELLEGFVRAEFPDFHPTWAAIEPRIKQLDSSRYMLMHRHGGVYLDVDVECVRSMDSLIEPLPPGAAWVGDWPEPMFLMSAPGAALWPHVLDRIARVWRELDAWHSTGPVGLGTAIREYVQKHGTGVLVPFLTADSRPEFQDYIKHKNGTVPWYELANGNFQLPDGSPLRPWHSPSLHPGVGAAAALPRLPASEGELPPHASIGFLANELLDPPGCNAGALAHCVDSFCNATWPLSYVVHHCMNTWRGRIGTT